MSFEGLQERLTALQETTTQLRELIDRLATIKFTPGAVPLATDEEGSASGEVSAEITQLLKDGEEERELLAEEVEFVRGSSHDKTRLRETVEKLEKELASCRLYFRKARLSAKGNLAHAQRLERELLIQSYSKPVSGAASPTQDFDEAPVFTRSPRYAQHQKSSLTEEDQKTVGASSNVTSALRRTHDLIAAELARSEYAHETLTESSTALKQLNKSYTSLDTMLASSKDLLGTLLRSQKSDTWYLQTALYMLMVTGAWLVFRRLLYGPMWWLVWLPLRFMFGAGTKVGSAVMHRGSSSAPGESGKVEIGDDHGHVPVEGLPDEDLPTIRVGQDAEIADKGKESVIEQVEKIVEAVNEAEELGSIPGADERVGEKDTDEEDFGDKSVEDENEDKRMWEEVPAPGVVAEDARLRDEL